jgi:acetate kinase
MNPYQMMKILVINTGSSSIKYQLFDMKAHQVLAHGLVERIGEAGSRLKHYYRSEEARIIETDIPNHERGMSELVQLLQADADSAVQAIGHRVVHGGEAFHEPTLIGEKVIAAIEEYSPLAPLHNPPNLIGIRAAGAHFPGVPQVAVFDT